MAEINSLPEEHRKKPMQRKYQQGIPAEQPAPVEMTRATKTTLAVLVAGALAAGTVWDSKANEGWYGRSIASASGLKEMKRSVQNPQRFPYSFSPWEEYARLEETLLTELQIPTELVRPQTAKAREVGNNIANRLATRILRARNTYDIAEAMQTVPRDWLIEAIANEIENEGIFYSPESLLSQAFDPKLHEEGGSTLDCDLLAHLMCHVGRQLDVKMYVIPGPSHAYLMIEAGDGEKVFVIEPTKFRKVIQRRTRDAIITDFTGHGIDEGFFSSFEKQREHGGIVAMPEYGEKARLHRPIEDKPEDEQFLREGMLSNILVGLYKGARKPELKERIYEKAWQLAQDAVNYNLSKNAYELCLGMGIAATERNETKKAIEAFHRAAWIRKTKELIGEPSELIGMGKILYKKNDIEAASKVLAEARDFYEKHVDGPILWKDGARYAWGEEHAVLLTYSVLVESLKDRTPSGETMYNQWVVPAFNQLNQRASTRALPEFQMLKEMIGK